jgi:hypothetical protein
MDLGRRVVSDVEDDLGTVSLVLGGRRGDDRDLWHQVRIHTCGDEALAGHHLAHDRYKVVTEHGERCGAGAKHVLLARVSGDAGTRPATAMKSGEEAASTAPLGPGGGIVPLLANGEHAARIMAPASAVTRIALVLLSLVRIAHPVPSGTSRSSASSRPSEVVKRSGAVDCL